MIIGIGTDIIAVSRIQEAFERNPGFGEKVFTTDEITYCQSKAHPYQSLAARFAAKEAVMKACKTGWNDIMTWQNIEVVCGQNGDPMIRLHRQSAEFMAKQGLTKVHLSLSHDASVAIAFVVLEKNDA